MGVSKNRGGPPKSSHFNRVFHYKPSILGYPYLYFRHGWLSMAFDQQLLTSSHQAWCLHPSIFDFVVGQVQFGYILSLSSDKKSKQAIHIFTAICFFEKTTQRFKSSLFLSFSMTSVRSSSVAFLDFALQHPHACWSHFFGSAFISNKGQDLQKTEAHRCDSCQQLVAVPLYSYGEPWEICKHTWS